MIYKGVVMEDNNLMKNKILVVRINEELHKDLKVAAAMRGISMSLLIHRALYKYLRIEDIDKQ